MSIKKRDHLSSTSRQERSLFEDLLKVMHNNEYRNRENDLDRLAGRMNVSGNVVAGLLSRLEAVGLISRAGKTLTLTQEGKCYALRVVRAHRVYETYLARQTGVTSSDWHAIAHAAEHNLTKGEVDRLAGQMGNPPFDPHGDPIPTQEGRMPPPKGTLLNQWPLGETATVSHVEDEPPPIYAELVAKGFAPGVRVRVLSETPSTIRIRVEGKEVNLTQEQAAQIRVESCNEGPPSEADLDRLSSLNDGESAVVWGISAACTGPERYRLLDLGVVPGTRVRRDFASPFGSPISYGIRGGRIALRREQAERILISASRKAVGGGQS